MLCQLRFYKQLKNKYKLFAGECDEDDLTMCSMEQAVVDLPYFYGDISREDAEVILWDRDCIEGMYLLRSSQNKDAKFVLSLCSNKRVHHYRIKETFEHLLFVHGVETKKYTSLSLLVDDISGLICKPTIACNKALNKIKPGHYYRLSSDELQRAIENKAKEWGIEGALESEQKKDLQYVVINTLHESQPWFHSKISRSKAEERLTEDGHEDGKFLIRERDDCCSYALCFSHNGEPKHYKIEVISTGEMRIKDGPRFENLLELVSHYSVLNDGLWCTLKEPCPRSHFEPAVANGTMDNTSNVSVQLPISLPSAETSRPFLEPPQKNDLGYKVNGETTTQNDRIEREPTETNKNFQKLKSSFVKVLPDLNLLKIAKASQSSRNETLASPVSSPSSPMSPMSISSPTSVKSFANLVLPDVPVDDMDSNNNTDKINGADSAKSEAKNVLKRVKRRAPVPLPRKDLAKVQEEPNKNFEIPVPKPRKDVAPKMQDTVNLPVSHASQALTGPSIGMSSVIKQLQQQLSVADDENNSNSNDAKFDSVPSSTIETSPAEVKVAIPEVTEPIYQEIDPTYDETNSKNGDDQMTPPTDEGYEREGRLGSASVSNNCFFHPRLHESGIRSPSRHPANIHATPKAPLVRIPFIKSNSFSAHSTYVNVPLIPPEPPKRKDSLPSKLQHRSIPKFLRHAFPKIRERVDENQEEQNKSQPNVSQPSVLQVQQVTIDNKRLIGLCRKPTWTREESEKHFRTVQRFRKNPMTINSKNIVLQEKMGTGNFGEVYKAHFKSDRVEVPFAVKMLKSSVPNAKADILREAKIMTGLDHPYIVRLIGICESDSFMLVMELAPLGPLNQYLKSNSSSVPVADILQLLHQTACGMEYLEKEMFVHRDLAARNVLLVNENFAKIGDFGMSRVVGLDKDYYQKKNLEGKLPLKWYAPECIQYCKFSSKSDVWSYGITMWEAMSYGEKPYTGMVGQDIWKMLLSGGRLEQPRDCPDYVYNIILQCWKFSADERPTFKELTSHLQDCMELSGHKV